MKTIKKTLAKVFALTLAFTLGIAVTGCGGGDSEAKKEKDFIASIGGVSETYKGSVSVVSYETAEDAAEAYVAEEVVGNNDVTVVKTESKGELTAAQVTALNLPQEVQEGIVSVEEMEVEYSMSAVSYSDTLNTNKKVKVYVIKYATNWKYYTPAPVTGETISKSYYDSVFNYEKYKNCTVSTSMDISMSMSMSYQGESEKMDMSMSLTQLVKYSEDKIYLEQTTSGKSDGQSYSQTIYAYLEMVDGEVVCYVKDSTMSTEWIVGDLYQIGFSSLEELTPFYDQYLDYTYFTKTDYGFQISDENAQKYIEETLAQDESIGSTVGSMLGENMQLDMFVKYYVSNGVLSGMREDASLKMNVNESGMAIKMNMDIIGQVKCTDYGTTVVTKPFN